MGEQNRFSFSHFILKEKFLLILLCIVISGALETFGAYFGLLLAPIILFKIKSYNIIDKSFIWVLLFSVSYALITTINGFNINNKGNLMFYAIYPPVFYLVGRYLINKWTSQFYFLLLLIILSLALPTIIDVFRDIMLNGFINVTRAVNTGTGKTMAATLRGAHVSLGISAFAIIFAPLASSKERIYKIIFVIIGILCITSTLHLLNRTGIIILFISIISIVMKNLKGFNPRILLFTFSILFLSIFFIYPKLENTNLVEAFKIREENTEYNADNAGGRLELWIKAEERILNNPINFGLNTNKDRDYVHNFWLDVEVVGGTFPFIALLILTGINFRKNYRLINSIPQISNFCISLLLTINIGFFLTCFVEPILEGSFTYVLSYFLFWGMTSILYRNSKLKELDCIP